MKLTRKQLRLVLKLARYWLDKRGTSWGLMALTIKQKRVEDLINDIEERLEAKE